MPSKLIQTFLF